MSNPLQKNRSGAAILAAWLMIGYILARVGYGVYEYIRWLCADEYNPSVVWISPVDVSVVLYLLRFAL